MSFKSTIINLIETFKKSGFFSNAVDMQLSKRLEKYLEQSTESEYVADVADFLINNSNSIDTNFGGELAAALATHFNMSEIDIEKAAPKKMNGFATAGNAGCNVADYNRSKGILNLLSNTYSKKLADNPTHQEKFQAEVSAMRTTSQPGSPKIQ